MTDIAIINATRSAGLADEQVKASVRALQVQVTRDFLPAWGSSATLHFYTHQDAAAGKIPDSYWWLAVIDDPDSGNTLGYHDLTPAGQPMGKAYAGNDATRDANWSVKVSHELLEMLADPDISLSVWVESAGRGAELLAHEVCDPCEPAHFGYAIDGISVSNFVYPAWFQRFCAETSARFDHQKHIEAPFQVLPGGYIGTRSLAATCDWRRITARENNGMLGPTLDWGRTCVGSRTERRARPAAQWQRSTSARQRSAGAFVSSLSIK